MVNPVLAEMVTVLALADLAEVTLVAQVEAVEQALEVLLTMCRLIPLAMSMKV